jgi:hypothetical protein
MKKTMKKAIKGLKGLDTEDNFAETAKATGINLLCGVAGLVGGAYLGKLALPLGICAMAGMHYVGYTNVASAGLGVALAGFFPDANTDSTLAKIANGKTDPNAKKPTFQQSAKKVFETGKQKNKLILDTVLKNTMLDKVFAKKTTTITTVPPTAQKADAVKADEKTPDINNVAGLGSIDIIELSRNQEGVYASTFNDFAGL